MSARVKAGLVLLGLILLGGCGKGGGSGEPGSVSVSTRSSQQHPDLCRVGKSVLPAIPDAPSRWQEGGSQPIALACMGDGASGGAALVGFRFGAGSCVASYDFRTRIALDERCTEPGMSWTLQCEGTPGCTSAFLHDAGSTQLDGPVDAKVGRVEAAVDGHPLAEGATFVSVRGTLARAIGAEEPFGFFYLAIPRCVEPDEVRVDLFQADGTHLGTAQGWDVIVDPCRELAQQRASSS